MEKKPEKPPKETYNGINDKKAAEALNGTFGLNGVFKVPSGTVSKQWDRLFSFSGVFQSTVGILNTTAFLYGQNRSDCQMGVEDILAAGNSSFEQLSKYSGYFNFLNFIDKFLEAPYLSDTIVFSCFYGVDEYSSLGNNYLKTFKDPSILKFNLIYNGGNLIHSVKNIVLYFYDSKYTRVVDPKAFGMEIGQMLWQVFYP